MYRAALNQIIFVLLLSIAIPDAMHAQHHKENSPCGALFRKAIDAYESAEYVDAVKYYNEVEALAKEKDLQIELFYAKNGKGMVYTAISNYAEALINYKEALKIAMDLNDPIRLAVAYNNLGVLYSREKDYENALLYYNKSYKVSNDSIKILLGINISDIYIKGGHYKEARQSLMSVEKIPMPTRIRQGWTLNYAETLIMEGRLSEAQKSLEGLINAVKPSDKQVYSALAKLLSMVYSKQHDIVSASKWAENGLKHAYALEDEIEFYDNLSQFHFTHGNYLKSRQYQDSVILAKDSLYARTNRGLFENNKVKLKIQDYQNELQVNKERQVAERNLYIIGIIIFILLFAFVYRGLKHKLDKQKQEKILSDNRQRITNLELENLKNSVAEKNRKLSAKALYLSGRNELIEEVVMSLTNLPEVSHQPVIKEYLKNLKGYVKTDDQWDDFIRYFEEINPEFLRGLTAAYPELNPSDIRFICYVYMNLETKEIGNIFNITYNAAKKRKNRIKEKLGIGSECNLYDFLLEFSRRSVDV